MDMGFSKTTALAEVFQALGPVPAAPAPNLNTFAPALPDAFPLNAAPEKKMKQCEELSMEAPADVDVESEDSAAKSKLERRREQNREAQRRFRQRARQETEKEAKTAAPFAKPAVDVDMSFLGKRVRDGPASLPIALPKVVVKPQQPALDIAALVAQIASQQTPAPLPAPGLPVNNVQLQLSNLLKMNAMNTAPLVSSAQNIATPAAQDPTEAAGETEQEKNLKKMKRRVQNREAQRRHRMRMKQGEETTGKDIDVKQSASASMDFLNTSVESIQVPSPAQLGNVAPANTQNLLQMWSTLRMPALGGAAPMAGLSI